MGVGDGTVQGVTQIRDRGPENLNYNIVVVGEGFQAGEQSTFQTAATAFRDSLFTYEPFATELSSNINMFRLDVDSVDSGTTLSSTCPGGTVRTYFDATYCGDGVIDRLLVVNTSLIEDTLNLWVPEWDVAVVVVNNNGYGGSGDDDVAVYSLGTPVTVPIHELGHSAFDLADEYDYWAGCNSGEIDRDHHPGPEPPEPNVTLNTDRATLKWASLVDPATPLPTTTNPDCTQCDTQASPVAVGTVGAFEGADYYHCDAYRPEYDCMMRNNGVPLCAVCQGVIVGVVRQGAFGLDECFVASAVYRDPRHPDVAAIRSWRDRHLQPGARGRLAMTGFTHLYNEVGPPLAGWISQRPDVARQVRTRLLEPLAHAVAAGPDERPASVD